MNDIQQAPKNNSRLIILVTILTSLSILTSGWLYYQNLQLQKQISQLSIKPSPSPTSTPAQSIEPIANWKTYTNNVFNYSLKVPNDYFVGLRGNINNINIEDLNNIEIFSSSQKMYYDNNIMYLGWSIKKSGKLLKDFAEANFRKNIQSSSKYSGLTYSTFNTIPTYTYTYHGKDIHYLCDKYESFNCSATTVEDDDYKVILFEKNNTIFSIFYTNTPIFDQILSTFKFTD